MREHRQRADHRRADDRRRPDPQVARDGSQQKHAVRQIDERSGDHTRAVTTERQRGDQVKQPVRQKEKPTPAASARPDDGSGDEATSAASSTVTASAAALTPRNLGCVMSRATTPLNQATKPGASSTT